VCSFCECVYQRVWVFLSIGGSKRHKINFPHLGSEEEMTLPPSRCHKMVMGPSPLGSHLRVTPAPRRTLVCDDFTSNSGGTVCVAKQANSISYFSILYLYSRRAGWLSVQPSDKLNLYIKCAISHPRDAKVGRRHFQGNLFANKLHHFRVKITTGRSFFIGQ